MTESPCRRRLTAFLGATAGSCAAALLAMSGASVAHAAPAANPCAASEIAMTVGNVAINMGMYLDSHPETDQVLTAAAGQPAGPQTLAMLKTYFDAHPQTGRDLEVIQRPVTKLTTQCNLPISLPQVLGLMQAVQQGGGLPAVPTSPDPAQVLSGPPAAQTQIAR